MLTGTVGLSLARGPSKLKMVQMCNSFSLLLFCKIFRTPRIIGPTLYSRAAGKSSPPEFARPSREPKSGQHPKDWSPTWLGKMNKNQRIRPDSGRNGSLRAETRQNRSPWPEQHVYMPPDPISGKILFNNCLENGTIGKNTRNEGLDTLTNSVVLPYSEKQVFQIGSKPKLRTLTKCYYPDCLLRQDDGPCSG